MPKFRKLKAMANALKLMEHLPVQDYGECRATLRQVRIFLNDQCGALWNRKLPVPDDDTPSPDFATARERITQATELIRYIPIDSYLDTAELLDAFDQSLADTIGKLLTDAIEQPFRLPPRIATENGERVLPFSEAPGEGADTTGLARTA